MSEYAVYCSALFKWCSLLCKLSPPPWKLIFHSSGQGASMTCLRLCTWNWSTLWKCSDASNLCRSINNCIPQLLDKLIVVEITNWRKTDHYIEWIWLNWEEKTKREFDSYRYPFEWLLLWWNKNRRKRPKRWKSPSKITYISPIGIYTHSKRDHFLSPSPFAFFIRSEAIPIPTTWCQLQHQYKIIISRLDPLNLSLIRGHTTFSVAP